MPTSPERRLPGDLAAKMEAARASRSMQGERRVVTILFCDVTGSTAMAEQLDPEDWAEIMDDAFDYLIAPVYRYEGTVARLMGDAILAFFGAPLAHEDDPQRAILAGLDIVSSLQPFREQVRKTYGLEFDVRVGINTGEVVVGEIGSDLQMEYTAMGDAVNLAARMEQAAAPGSVQISEHTHRLVAPLFDFEALGEIAVKGKSEPVRAYRVLRRKEQPGRLRGIAGLEAPLIGRSRELDLLRQAMLDLHQGRGTIITLVGEAGLGKSRLIDELHANWTEEPGRATAWFETRGVSYDATQPYGLFYQHFRHFHGVTEADPIEVVLQKVASMVPTQNQEQSSLFNQMVGMLQDAQAESQPASLQGEAFKQELFATVYNLCYQVAANTPLVMVLDDLHWADPVSVELLLHLFQLTDLVPILFICAFRPYRPSPGWQVKQAAETDYPHRYTEIQLLPLSDEDSGLLVDRLLAISDLPQEIRQLILRKAEGNPFFVEEVVRSLIDQGAIERDETGLHWQAVKKVESLDIPDNLQALLIARIDRLEESTRHVLQLAAVIGRSFYYRVLQAIADAYAELDRQLSTLQRVELIRELARHPELEYMFLHELTRDAAYQSILHRRRRQFHLQVAEAIESLYAEKLEEEAHRLEYHFEEAREFTRALRYARLAGDYAARLDANTEAESHYRRAIELAHRSRSPDEELAYLYTRRGRALEKSVQFDAAIAAYQELEHLGQERDNPALVLAALIPQATIYAIPTVKNDPQKSQALIDRALPLARQLDDRRAEAMALWNQMLVEYIGNNNPAQAVVYGEQALAIARQAGQSEDLAYILHDLARVYDNLGRSAAAWDVLLESQALWREIGDLTMLSDSLGTQTQKLYVQGDFQSAIQAAEEGLRLSRRTNNLWGQAFHLNNLGPLYLERGDIDQSLQALEQTPSLAEQASFLGPQLSARMILAWVRGQLGDLEYEREESRRLSSHGESHEPYHHLFQIWDARRQFLNGDPAGAYATLEALQFGQAASENIQYFGPVLVILIGDIILANGQFDQMLAIAEDSQARMQAAGVRLFLPDILLLKGRALEGLNRIEEAVTVLNEAYLLATEQHSRRSLWPILYAMARLETVRSNQEAAARLHGEARQTIQYIADHISSPALKQSFLNLPQVRQVIGAVG